MKKAKLKATKPATPAAGKSNAGLQQSDSKPNSRPWLAKYRWQPGQSGNKSGKRRGTVSITAALKRLLERGDACDQIARAIVDAVVSKKDAGFAKLLLDRIDGSLREQMEMRLSGNIAPVANPVSVTICIPDNGRGGPYPPDPLPDSKTVAALPTPKPEATKPEPEPKPVEPVADNSAEQEPDSPSRFPILKTPPPWLSGSNTL